MKDSSSLCITSKHIGFPSVTLFRDLSFTLHSNQFTALLGPSGCGKSTLFRLLSGLSLPHGLQVDSFQSSHPLADQTSILLQRDGLFPWLSVFENVSLRYHLKDRPPLDLKERILDMLNKVGLAKVANALPSTLSGGMRQRVALARVLLDDRPIILMDEPFSSLDPVTRESMYQLSKEYLATKTVFFITHNHSEARTLAPTILEVNPFSKIIQKRNSHD